MCSASLMIREMLTKPLGDNTSCQLGCVLPKNQKITNAGEGMKKGNSCTLSVEMKIGTAIMKNSTKVFLKKSKNELPYDLVIPLWVISTQGFF